MLFVFRFFKMYNSDEFPWKRGFFSGEVLDDWLEKNSINFKATLDYQAASMEEIVMHFSEKLQKKDFLSEFLEKLEAKYL